MQQTLNLQLLELLEKIKMLQKVRMYQILKEMIFLEIWVKKLQKKYLLKEAL